MIIRDDDEVSALPIQWGTVRHARSPSEYGGGDPDIFGLGRGPGHYAQEQHNVFGLDQERRLPAQILPWERDGNVFGLGQEVPAEPADGTAERRLAVLTALLMTGVGGLVAGVGTTIKNSTVDWIVRGVAAGMGVFGIYKLFTLPKVEMKCPPGYVPDPDDPSGETCIKAKTPGPANMEGLGRYGDQWPTSNPYVESFYKYIDPRKHMDGLGQIEYWVVDPETPDVALVRMQCPPFMLGPGLQVRRIGPKGHPAMGDLGSDGMGFWEVLSPSGMRVAAMRCRPHYTQMDLTVKQVTAGKEFLRKPGAAPFPPGTERERRGTLVTTRRG